VATIGAIVPRIEIDQRIALAGRHPCDLVPQLAGRKQHRAVGRRIGMARTGIVVDDKITA